jgi:hypothetical protein
VVDALRGASYRSLLTEDAVRHDREQGDVAKVTWRSRALSSVALLSFRPRPAGRGLEGSAPAGPAGLGEEKGAGRA